MCACTYAAHKEAEEDGGGKVAQMNPAFCLTDAFAGIQVMQLFAFCVWLYALCLLTARGVLQSSFQASPTMSKPFAAAIPTKLHACRTTEAWAAFIAMEVNAGHSKEARALYRWVLGHETH